MSIKESIGWTDKTWNPIKGICPVRCWYCYGKKIYKRFRWDGKPRLEEKAFFDDVISMMKAKAKKIFICSTFELFHPITNSPCPWYPKISWRGVVILFW